MNPTTQDKLKSELENIFKNVKNSVYPKYKLIDAGERVEIEVTEKKFIILNTHHISEEGLLCDDLETYIKWEMFS
jgi:hypothetical protein